MSHREPKAERVALSSTPLIRDIGFKAASAIALVFPAKRGLGHRRQWRTLAVPPLSLPPALTSHQWKSVHASPQAYLFVLYEFSPFNVVLGAKLTSFAHMKLLRVTYPNPKLDNCPHPWGSAWVLGPV